MQFNKHLQGAACSIVNKKSFPTAKGFFIIRRQMASLLELTETGYRNIERGITEAGTTKLFKIAEILKVPVPQLLNIVDENPGNKNENILHAMKADESVYRLCIDQYKAENQFLKKQLSLMEELLSKAMNA